MNNKFVKVAAIEKGAIILELLAQSKKPLGSREIANALGYYVGTVYNILYTYNELGFLDIDRNKKFSLGRKLIELGKAASKELELIPLLHSYIDDINKKTNLTTLLSIRSGMRSIVIDKVESDYSLKFSPGYGREITVLGGAVGKALLSQLPDDDLDFILAHHELKRYTPYTCTDKKKFKEIVLKVRRDGIAVSDEERNEGVCALAIPLPNKKTGVTAAIWIIGLKSQMQKKGFQFYKDILKKTAELIESRLR